MRHNGLNGRALGRISNNCSFESAEASSRNNLGQSAKLSCALDSDLILTLN